MYNHEQKYLRAMGTLYRNRGKNSPKPPGSQQASGEGLGAGAGLLGAMLPHKQGPNPATMSNAIKSAQMANAIQQAQLVSEMQQVAKDQKARQQNAEGFLYAPVNGRFSSTGYQDHAKQSSKQAMDIETSKRLMHGGYSLGMGGLPPFDPERL